MVVHDHVADHDLLVRVVVRVAVVEVARAHEVVQEVNRGRFS